MRMDWEALRQEHRRRLVDGAKGCIAVAVAAAHEQLSIEMIDEAARLRRAAGGCAPRADGDEIAAAPLTRTLVA